MVDRQMTDRQVEGWNIQEDRWWIASEEDGRSRRQVGKEGGIDVNGGE